MEIWLVGGAVRDLVMGIEPKDKDYVVVGATPAEMVRLGYKQVGADFPVFLHPSSGEEYALARIERKTGIGYLGFECDASPTVTLEQDLSRRDLTMNAMALPFSENGIYYLKDIIDPFDGQGDISIRCLKHVSDAFREDPVRILRIARFAARYDFDISFATLQFIQQMVEDGEFDNLEPSRVWKEIEKGLMEDRPRRMFKYLRLAGALERIPHFGGGVLGGGLYECELRDLVGLPLHIRFATIASTFGGGREKYDAAKIPNECRDLAIACFKYLEEAGTYLGMTAVQKVEFLTKTHGIGSKRNTSFFDDFQTVMQMRMNYRAEIRGPSNWEEHLETMYEDRMLLKALDVQPTAEQAKAAGMNIGQAVTDYYIATLDNKQKSN